MSNEATNDEVRESAILNFFRKLGRFFSELWRWNSDVIVFFGSMGLLVSLMGLLIWGALLSMQPDYGLWTVTQTDKSWNVTEVSISSQCASYVDMEGKKGRVCGNYSLRKISDTLVLQNTFSGTSDDGPDFY